MELSTEFREKYIAVIEGQDFIRYPGLIVLAKKTGKLKELKVELLQFPSPENGNLAIVKATAIDSEGNRFEALGDADDKNCNRKVAPAKIRMADTRSKGRALRDLLGIGMIMLEEINDNNVVVTKENIEERATKEPVQAGQIDRITNLMVNLDRGKALELYKSLTGKETLREATIADGDLFIAHLEKMVTATTNTESAEIEG
jgi:hypothetical protein